MTVPLEELTMTLLYPVESNKAHPAPLSPAYKSSIKRAPAKPLIPMRPTLSELTGPVYGHETVREGDSDLTRQHTGEPLGERIIVHGHVLDEEGRGVPHALVEIWQANACGRYIHIRDQHPAPLDRRRGELGGHEPRRARPGADASALPPRVPCLRVRHVLTDKSLNFSSLRTFLGR